ncbi:RidA family protein [Colwellia ponticola]|uniref:RidA family protein n=1 Tax=Colwellia ponticola TaxID=2304625 RepID=A0A8H2PMI5_9GAMM|nr:RidA family protein [Colwellia ponticola]TMM46477.1 RidA family protein [Colwellia ponticola]
MTIIRKRNSEKVSRIVIHNDTVYLCGQVALDVTEDMAGQTKSVFARIDEHLAEAGTDNSKILSALIHVKDNKDVPLFNELWNEWLPAGQAPARSCVQSTMARDVVLVEVTITAAL